MSVSPSVVIVACIAGAAASVLLGSAVYRMMGYGQDVGNRSRPNDQQQEYMREVRNRNMFYLGRGYEIKRGDMRGE